MTTPSPRPAALVTAKALALAVGIETGGDCQIAESEAEAILRNLSGYGLVLIPRAELEEAAEKERGRAQAGWDGASRTTSHFLGRNEQLRALGNGWDIPCAVAAWNELVRRAGFLGLLGGA